MLRGAATVAAGAAAATMLRATPAGATPPQLITGAVNNGSTTTILHYDGGATEDSLFTARTPNWPGTTGYGRGAVTAYGDDLVLHGIVGFTTGSIGAGVFGFADAAGAQGIFADGRGRDAAGALASNASRGLVAQTAGTHQALYALTNSSLSTKDAVRAETAGTGAGVYATSAEGAGGKFRGATAHVVLEPATGSHPASGTPGALFVDNQHRLWFCKGGTDWHQLA